MEKLDRLKEILETEYISYLHGPEGLKIVFGTNLEFTDKELLTRLKELLSAEFYTEEDILT